MRLSLFLGLGHLFVIHGFIECNPHEIYSTTISTVNKESGIPVVNEVFLEILVHIKTSVALSKFYKTDFSGASLHYADISLTNMNGIILDNNTNTKSINLLSKGYYFEWEEVRNNKELIDVIMNQFDKNNFDPKMKKKIFEDNPDYF